MNILEHYIEKIIKIDEIPEHEFEDIDGTIKTLPTHWEVIYVANCYGDVKEYKRWYFSQEELGKDLNRGYFLA